MAFEIVDTSSKILPHAINIAGGELTLWPVYQTEDLLMCRVLVEKGTICTVDANELTHFIYVAAGGIVLNYHAHKDTALAGIGFEISEGTSFSFNVSEEFSSASLIVVIGSQLLPGSFFNTLTNAYA